ncbi:hypothetical protein HK099_006014 [Clydaea vesicula]|uniref:Uncharacterized protein n=1 Tax=Clydaea vesicula TaxID=447962 RepID=A0AAD5XUI9_9FUNG|nr:hypothetical protein HK099_006014 [Clydaea vesicula]KAJ3395979.1 hypothetical protein HDU92_004476 [Lobulomyces angularis]
MEITILRFEQVDLNAKDSSSVTEAIIEEFKKDKNKVDEDINLKLVVRLKFSGINRWKSLVFVEEELTIYECLNEYHFDNFGLINEHRLLWIRPVPSSFFFGRYWLNYNREGILNTTCKK